MSGKPSSVYYVSSHGGKWLYGKKGGMYSLKSAALNRAAYLIESGYADTVEVFESTPIEWTKVEDFS